MKETISALVVAFLVWGIAWGSVWLEDNPQRNPFYQAARAEMLTVPQCEPIAQAGGILIYRCQLEYGPPVFVNTIGFMMVEE